MLGCTACYLNETLTGYQSRCFFEEAEQTNSDRVRLCKETLQARLEMEVEEEVDPEDLSRVSGSPLACQPTW